MVYEVEIKLKICKNDIIFIEKYLRNNKIHLLSEFQQKDIYFETNPPTYAHLDKALRLRIEQSFDNKISNSTLEMTYKGPKISSNTKTREELSLKFDSSTESDKIVTFFMALNFYQKGLVQKRRKNYTIKPNIIMSLDLVDSLGTFLELETISNSEEEIPEAENQLWILLENISNGKLSKAQSITKSYLELLMEKELLK